MVFFAVEYQALSFCWLYQVDELSVMVFLILTENNNVVGYGYHACQIVKMLIHPALECLLRYVQSEGQAKPTISAKWSSECRDFFSKCIAEYLGFCKLWVEL